VAVQSLTTAKKMKKHGLTLTLLPNPAKKGFVNGGNRALMSRMQLILNCSGFRSITSLLYNDDTTGT